MTASKLVLPVVVINATPTVAEDRASGYQPGMLWLNTTSGTLYVCKSNAVGAANWASVASAGGGGGTVTSVALALPSMFTVSGSPVTVSGTLTGALATQTATFALLGPTSGAAAAPTFRALGKEDINTALASALLAGANITITNNGNGTFTIAASGGGSTMTPDYSVVVSVTAATTLTSSAVKKIHICSGTSADYTVTLPTTGLTVGDVITLQMGKALTKLVTIDAGAGHLLDGQQTRTMWAGEVATVSWDGVDWARISGKTAPMCATVHQILGSGQSIPTATITKVTINTATIDIGGMANVANNRIVIRRAGTYRLSAKVAFDLGVQCPRVALYILKNGTTILTGAQNCYGTASYVFPVISATAVVLAAGDTLELHAFQNSAGALGVLDGSATVINQFITADERMGW